MCVLLVYKQLISTEYVRRLPGDKALRKGWETREGRKSQGGQPAESSGSFMTVSLRWERQKKKYILIPSHEKTREKKKKKTFRFTYLPSPSGEPCWPRYFQSPLSECESRAVAIHFTQRKKTVFLIKRADDGQAAARARGERGTGA